MQLIKNNNQICLTIQQFSSTKELNERALFHLRHIFSRALKVLKVTYLHIFVGFKEANNFFVQSLSLFYLCRLSRRAFFDYEKCIP